MKDLGELFYQLVFRYKSVAKCIFVLIVAIVTIFLYESDILSRLELLAVDYRFILRPHKVRTTDIVFIEMAEDSIEDIGRWPWSRKWHATLVSALSEYGARKIAFDVLFSESQDEIDDSVFEQAIKRSKVVYLPFLYNLSIQTHKYLYKGRDVLSVLRPIQPFRKWIEGTGHVNTVPDSDGTLRRIPPIIKYHGKETYQFGFKIGCDMLGLREEDIIFYPDKHFILLKKPDGPVVKVPLDKDNQLIINWQGRWGKVFKHYSYIDVIRSYALMREGKTPPIDLNVFRNKVCIIGLTALGLIDIKPIPIENAYPAVGINAMVISNVVNGDFVHETPRNVDLLLILLVSTFVTLYLFRLRPLNGMLFSIVSMITYVAVSMAIFNIFNFIITTFYPVCAILLSYGLTASYVQIQSTIERTRLFKQATRDGLTHLYNIRHFTLLLETEFKHVSLYKQRRLAIIMADLDNFKHINDTYGHQAGDAVLRSIAKIAQSKCRHIDVVARYGGEEFIIMLVGAGKDKACDIAEKIRAGIENKKFHSGEVTYQATISIGAVEYSDEKSKEELIEKADKALYKAKRDGKNRVYAYDPSME